MLRSRQDFNLTFLQVDYLLRGFTTFQWFTEIYGSKFTKRQYNFGAYVYKSLKWLISFNAIDFIFMVKKFSNSSSS